MKRSRPLHVENLERRLMLAADVAAFQNPLDANDVNNDNYVTARDALIMINLINEPDSWGDKVGGFIDTSGDQLFTNLDALHVINSLNAPEIVPTGNAEKFEKLVQTLDTAPVTLDGKLKDLADQLIATQEEIDRANDLMRAELDEFLQFSLEQQAALETRLDDIESNVDFSFKLMEREIQETADAFASLDPAFFESEEFDSFFTTTEVGQPVVPDPHEHELDEDPAMLDFLPEDFEWTDVDDLGNGLEALFTDLQEVVSESDMAAWDYDHSSLEDLFTSEEQSWLIELETVGTTLGDFLTDQMETAAAEDWLLQGGDDVATLVDAMQADLANNEASFVDFVDEYFTEESGFLGLVDDLMDGCVNGEMHYGDHVAIGGETTGSIIEVDENTLFELDLHDDPELLAAAEALHEQPVMVFGNLYKVEGVEIPERTIMDVQMILPQQKITELTNKFQQLNLPLGSSLAGKFEELYVDNVSHYMDAIDDVPIFDTLTNMKFGSLFG